MSNQPPFKALADFLNANFSREELAEYINPKMAVRTAEKKHRAHLEKLYEEAITSRTSPRIESLIDALHMTSFVYRDFKKRDRPTNLPRFLGMCLGKLISEMDDNRIPDHLAGRFAVTMICAVRFLGNESSNFLDSFDHFCSKRFRLFTSDEISRVLDNRAMLGKKPSDNFMHNLSNRYREFFSNAMLIDLSRFMMAHALMDVRPPESAIRLFEARANILIKQHNHGEEHRVLEKFLSKSLWSFAKLGILPPKDFMDAATSRFTELIKHLSERETSALLWTMSVFHVLGYKAAQEVSMPFAGKMSGAISAGGILDFETLHMCNTWRRVFLGAQLGCDKTGFIANETSQFEKDAKASVKSYAASLGFRGSAIKIEQEVWSPITSSPIDLKVTLKRGGQSAVIWIQCDGMHHNIFDYDRNPIKGARNGADLIHNHLMLRDLPKNERFARIEGTFVPTAISPGRLAELQRDSCDARVRSIIDDAVATLPDKARRR